MNKKFKIVFLILAILLGVFLFVYGGYDDSPGAQGLGVLAVIGGVSGAIKNTKGKLIS
jgi:drug/metabolite transporter (DMT)-like permease